MQTLKLQLQEQEKEIERNIDEPNQRQAQKDEVTQQLQRVIEKQTRLRELVSNNVAQTDKDQEAFNQAAYYEEVKAKQAFENGHYTSPCFDYHDIAPDHRLDLIKEALSLL